MAKSVYDADASDSQTDPQIKDPEAGDGPIAAETHVFPMWLETVDRLHELRHYLECAYMAMNQLHPLECDPLQFATGHVSLGMQDLADEIHAKCRRKRDEDESEDEDESDE